MKKILSLIAAGAMALGLIGCSGDLHDDVKVDPNAMKGYWSYRVIDTAGDDSINVITNNAAGQSGAYGSPDFAVDVSSGTAAIIWDGKGGSDLTVSTRTDCPSLSDINVTLNDGEACIFVFTPYTSVNLYCYPIKDVGAFTSDKWPGTSTTATVKVEKVKATITIKIVNGTPGTTYWFSGLSWDAGWPYAKWGGDVSFATSEEKAKYRATADAEGNATFPTAFESEADPGSSLSFACKIVDIVTENLEAGDPSYDSGVPENQIIDIGTLTSSKAFTATFDVGAKTVSVE